MRTVPSGRGEKAGKTSFYHCLSKDVERDVEGMRGGMIDVAIGLVTSGTIIRHATQGHTLHLNWQHLHHVMAVAAAAAATAAAAAAMEAAAAAMEAVGVGLKPTLRVGLRLG